MKLFYLILCTVILWTSCKEPGCTDPLATNYNTEANKDDGSCEYRYPVKINIKLTENGRSLSVYGTYENNNISYRLESFKYYLSHLKLNNNEVADVFLYDIENENNQDVAELIQDKEIDSINDSICKYIHSWKYVSKLPNCFLLSAKS